MVTRIYLTGSLRVEGQESFIGERTFGSRQARLAFVYLAVERGRPVPREELADAIWPQTLPPSWDGALSAIVSKVRRLLKSLGQQAPDITMSSGSHQLGGPGSLWIDIEAAGSSIDLAEGLLRNNQPDRAWGAANVGAAIASRSFLPREDAEWVERERQTLRDIHLRSLECLSQIAFWNGELPLAARLAAQAVQKEPYREEGYRRLMRVHDAMGNRAEAIRVYESCRRLLAAELGVRPSNETEALYLALASPGGHLPP